MDMYQIKAEYRKAVRAKRDGITPKARAKAEDAFTKRLLALPALKTAKTIAVYQSIDSEISLDGAVAALYARKDPALRIAYPVITQKGVMAFVEVREGERAAFLTNPRKIVGYVPKERLVFTEEFDIVFTPGIAFDESCHRLGQGGGYYDRCLARVKRECLTIGVAFDEQVFSENIPTAAHDRRVGYVLTPTRLISK